MIILKNIRVTQEDIGKDIEDFFVSFEALIGPDDNAYVYEIYEFYAISLKRLIDTFPESGIMHNKGWFIMRYYDITEIEIELKEIIEKSCKSGKDIYSEIDCYLFRISE